MTQHRHDVLTLGQHGPKCQDFGKALPNRQISAFLAARKMSKSTQLWLQLSCLQFSGNLERAFLVDAP